MQEAGGLMMCALAADHIAGVTNCWPLIGLQTGSDGGLSDD